MAARADRPSLLLDRRLPRHHDIPGASPDARGGHAVAPQPHGHRAAAGDGRRHPRAREPVQVGEVGRLEVRRARQALLARVEDLGHLEVRQPVDAVVGVRHGVARRLLGARRGGAVAGVVARVRVAGLEHAREHVGEQRAQGDDARADDADVDLDDAEVRDGGAVPGHVHGQGGLLDRQDAGYGHDARAVGAVELAGCARFESRRRAGGWTSPETKAKQDCEHDSLLSMQLQRPCGRDGNSYDRKVCDDIHRRRQRPNQKTLQAGVLHAWVEDGHGCAGAGEFRALAVGIK